MRYLLFSLLFCFAISASAQMDETKFNSEVAGHGWHPMERGLWLFSGTHTIGIGEYNAYDNTNSIRLAGVNQDSGEDWRFEGRANVTFEGKYFQLELLNDEMHPYASYIYGFLMPDGNMQFAATTKAVEMSEANMKKLSWYGSRY